MKRWRFHQEVADEVERTVRWYQRQRSQLGDDFIVELDDVLAQLESGTSVTSPEPEDARARRVFLKRFPYAVVFVEAVEEYFVLAVAHLHREPGYWLSRIDER